MARIAIDLVPLRAGGVNGGAGVMARYLLDHLSELGQDLEFVLLAAPWNEAELAKHVRPGVSLRRLNPDVPPVIPPEPAEPSLMSSLETLRRHLPPGILRRLLPLARRIKVRLYQQKDGHKKPVPSSKVQSGPVSDVDVLFCPFTAVTNAEPGIRVVSYVHDLQHRAYPQFFSGEEIVERDAYFSKMAERADAILCNSNHTRQTLYEYFPATRKTPVSVVPVSIHTRLKDRLAGSVRARPEGLPTRPYLFYPANYWPHKNHALLLTAFGIFAARNPTLQADLVFTGALQEASEQLRYAAGKMGLAGRVHFLPYLSDSELAEVFRNCSAVIYPSLFEGFGIPLLEAFLFGKPVLCSQRTSLPEIAGEAALYFDPRKPHEIASAIDKFFSDPRTSRELAEKSHSRLEQFAPEKMWAGYRAVLLAEA